MQEGGLLWSSGILLLLYYGTFGQNHSSKRDITDSLTSSEYYMTKEENSAAVSLKHQVLPQSSVTWDSCVFFPGTSLWDSWTQMSINIISWIQTNHKMISRTKLSWNSTKNSTKVHSTKKKKSFNHFTLASTFHFQVFVWTDRIRGHNPVRKKIWHCEDLKYKTSNTPTHTYTQNRSCNT